MNELEFFQTINMLYSEVPITISCKSAKGHGSIFCKANGATSSIACSLTINLPDVKKVYTSGWLGANYNTLSQGEDVHISVDLPSIQYSNYLNDTNYKEHLNQIILVNAKNATANALGNYSIKRDSSVFSIDSDDLSVMM